VATSLPALQAEFEVASVRPCQMGTPPGPPFQPGGRVHMGCLPLKFQIEDAWNIKHDDMLAGPKWLNSVAGTEFDIVAKVSPATEGLLCVRCQSIDMDVLRPMIRTLLVDRFKIAAHYEDRPMDAYTLVAAKPKLKKAAPSNRTGCKRANAPGAWDPGNGPPPTLLTCQNITMTQFAEQLQGMPISIHNPVLDATGIDGAWDFSLTFDPIDRARGGGGFGSKGGGPTGTAPGADPSGVPSLYEAVEKQLGLKLEKHQRPEPVLVIDHIEEKPADN